MALRPLNSIAGFSVGDPAIAIVQANGDITTINLNANGLSNLGLVSNVTITGGSNGQVLSTDGNGVLSFTTVNTTSNNAAPMPYLIPNGESYIVNENFQGLYSNAITIDGELVVDGMLIEIVDTVASEDTQVLYDNNGIPTGNIGFTFLAYNGNLNVPGNINVTGSVIPASNDTFDLGTANARWGNGYFGGNTIYLDTATISVDANGFVVITNELGGTFKIEGTEETSTTEIENGTSNVKVYANGNVATTVGGVANVLIVTTAGANLTGNLTTGGVKTDNLYYANGNPYDLGGNPAGSNTQIQFNNANAFGGSANLTFNNSTNILELVGTIKATNLDITGNGIIGGNLTVNGNLIYINVEEFSVEDPIISLNTGANGTAPVSNTGKDIGSALNYYDTQARVAFMGWDTSNAEFAFGSQTTIASEVVTFTTLGNVRAQTFKGNVEATTISGSLTTASQANITTVGTLGSLSVTGNISAGNISGGNLVSSNYLVSTSGCVSINGSFLAYDSSTGSAGIFTSGATDINLGLAANVTIGSTTGNVTARGNLIANNISTTGNISANLITGILTTNAQPNVTSIGTLTSLSITGNVSANNATANTVTTNSTISKRSNIAVTTDTVIDSFSNSAYRTAKYVIKSENDDGYESLEVLLIHNNINSYVTVYAAINDGGGNTVNITTGISSGNVELRATGIAANTVVNLIGTYVPD